MNKAELVEKISEMTGVSKTLAGEMLNAFCSVVTDTLANGSSVAIMGFCSLVVQMRAERVGRDLRTGDKIVIPARRVVKFKAGKTLKERVE